MPTAEALEALVERAYHIFPAAKLEGLGVCACGICMSAAEQARVAGLDRKRIATEDLRAWYDAAGPDGGRVPRKLAEHLAPRILEMVAENEDVWEIEVAFRRFAFGDGALWQHEQRALLDAFRDAFIDTFQTGAPGVAPLLDDMFCMMAIGRFDLGPVFARIEDWPTENLINRLWNDWCGWGRHGVWRTAFWEPTADDERPWLPAAAEQTAAWYPRAAGVALESVYRDNHQDTGLWHRAAEVEALLARHDRRA